MRIVARLTQTSVYPRHTARNCLVLIQAKQVIIRRSIMLAQLMRAAAVAAVTSVVGYAVISYRNRLALKGEETADKLAVQEWETDGGSNLVAGTPGGAEVGARPRTTRVKSLPDPH